MKKALSLLLLAALCLSFSGCDLYQGKKRLVAMTYEGEIYDTFFNQQSMEGLKLLADQARVSYYENKIPEEFSEKLEIIINEHHEFIWVVEPEGTEELLVLAEKYPKQSFGLLYQAPEPLSDNVTAVTFREYEGSFLAGYIAGKTTQTGIVGYLGGVEDQTSLENEFGFKSGVVYAGREREKSIQVKSDYTKTYTDRSVAEEKADALYQAKCDVIYQTARIAGLGAIDSAVKNNELIIGYGSDQSSMAPRNVLTSVILDITTAVNNVSTDFLDEKVIGGTHYSYGLKERIVGISKTNTNMDKKIYTQMLELRQRVAEGSLVIPKTEEEYKAYAESLLSAS